jgi:hypothetical protein
LRKFCRKSLHLYTCLICLNFVEIVEKNIFSNTKKGGSAMHIKQLVFDKLDAIELTTSSLKLVLTLDLGPRIAFFGRPEGPNLLYWQNDDKGYGDWKLLGGHRVWVTRPLADESEDAYAPDNDPCELETLPDGIRAVGKIDPRLKIQRGIEVRAVDEKRVEIKSFLTNHGMMLFSGGMWTPTCLDPAGGKEFGVLLGDRSQSWDIIRMVIPRSFAGHTGRVNDPQIEMNEEFMVVRPNGTENKRMLYAPSGGIAMTWPAENLTFMKHSRYNPVGSYPLGCNLAFYTSPGNFMVELECCGLEQTVLPGSTIELAETWTLADVTLDWKDPEAFKKLFG